MSDGRSFALNKPVSDEERLEDLERKYGVLHDRLHERIVAHNDLLLEFSSLKKSHSELSSALHIHVKDFQDSKNDFRRHIASLSSSHVENTTKINALASSLKDLSNRVETSFNIFDTKFASIIDSIFNIPHQIKSLTEDHLSIKEFSVYQAIQKQLFDDQAKRNLLNQEAFGSLQSSISSLSKDLSERAGLLNEHGKAISSFLIWINGYEDKVDKRMEEQRLAASVKIASDYKEMAERLDTIKKEMSCAAASNASAEEKMRAELQDAIAKSANAVQTIQASQNRFQALEKKIEASQMSQERIKFLEKKIDSLMNKLTRYEIK